MKMLNAVFVALLVPMMLLNVFGSIVSGIWLAILGKWKLIIFGIFSTASSPFLLGLAMMPGVLLALPIAKFAERKNYVRMYIFWLAGIVYKFSVITIWSMGMMAFFLQHATEGTVVPLLLWSYGVAIGPLGYLASKDSDNEYSRSTVVISGLAYIAAGLWVLIGTPSGFNVVVLMGCIMGAWMITMFVGFVTKLSESSADFAAFPN